MLKKSPSPGVSVSTVSPLNWFPLATEQLRLRSVSEVAVFHPSCQGTHSDDTRYYITCHQTPLSPPFFTSASNKALNDRVTWADLDQVLTEYGGVKSVIIRLWSSHPDTNNITLVNTSLSVWGVTFAGLVCVGDKISKSIAQDLNENSLVFKLQHHYFICNDCLQKPLTLARFMEVPFITHDSCKSSYDRTSLTKLAATLRALKQIEVSNGRVKKEISERLDPELSRNSVSVPANTANVSASLRQKIFSVQPKQPATKMAEVNLAVKIENTKYRIALLHLEKERIKAEMVSKKDARQKSVDDGDSVNNHLLENYHTLSKDKDKLESWLSSVQESRDCNVKTRKGLLILRNRLISQLTEIFPIHDSASHHPTICHVVVPSSENMKERDEKDLSVGLGWVAHLTLMVSSLLGVPLRYPTLSEGSKSFIFDMLLDIPDREKKFPLFPKGVESVKFEYGVYLLNMNISQLRWYCDLTTQDLRPTLSNMSGLLDTCSAACHVSSSNSSPVRHQLPVAPAVLAGVARLTSSLADLCGPSPIRRSHDKHEKVDISSDVEVVEEETKVEECDITMTMDNIENSNSDENNYNVVEHSSRDNYISEKICDSISDINLNENSISSKTEVNSQPLEEDLKRSVINGDETIEAVDQRSETNQDNTIEEAVEAADLFWDSVADRTHALSVPNSFKRPLSRPY